MVTIRLISRLPTPTSSSWQSLTGQLADRSNENDHSTRRVIASSSASERTPNTDDDDDDDTCHEAIGREGKGKRKRERKNSAYRMERRARAFLRPCTSIGCARFGQRYATSKNRVPGHERRRSNNGTAPPCEQPCRVNTTPSPSPPRSLPTPPATRPLEG